VIALRFLRHGSNALLIAGVGALALGATLGAFALIAWAVALGVLLFFLSEYGTHRYLLHAPPMASAFILRLQHRLHYDHHVEPERLDLLFLPPWFLVPALALFAVAYLLISRSTDITASLVLGNLIGLLYYEWVHYVAHIPFKPLTPYGGWIKKYHLRHHFKNEHLWFGVTNPALDAVIRTYRPVAEAERSDTVRVLFPRGPH
jgi:hypothetical protein